MYGDYLLALEVHLQHSVWCTCYICTVICEKSITKLPTSIYGFCLHSDYYTHTQWTINCVCVCCLMTPGLSRISRMMMYLFFCLVWSKFHLKQINLRNGLPPPVGTFGVMSDHTIFSFQISKSNIISTSKRVVSLVITDGYSNLGQEKYTCLCLLYVNYFLFSTVLDTQKCCSISK